MSLPEWNIPAIKVKIDTGARSSALHALDITPFSNKGVPYVRFTIEPVQRLTKPRISCEAKIIDQRKVRDSGGHTELRYVVSALLRYNDREKLIDLTLTRRPDMLFRMLLGRTAMMPDILVDPGASYRLGRLSSKDSYKDYPDR